jgi:hypothetical protein
MGKNRAECKRMEEDYGLLFISMENLYEHQFHFLFSPDNQFLNIDSKVWSCLEYYKHPCNTITLVDNHLLKKENDLLEKYLVSLFDALLPKNLNKMSFRIDIFTEKNDRITPKLQHERKKMIEECVINLRPNYKHKIEINLWIEQNPDEHDRYLFTNYGLFQSGNGFVLTNLELRRGTLFNFFPITHHTNTSNNNSTFKIVQDLRKKKRK